MRTNPAVDPPNLADARFLVNPAWLDNKGDHNKARALGATTLAFAMRESGNNATQRPHLVIRRT